MTTGLYISVLIMLIVAVIPTGLIFSFLFDRRDIRKLGSGNIGGTNIGRIYGWTYGILIILLDACKAAFIVSFVKTLSIVQNLGPNQLFSVQILVGIAVILLNTFNPLLRFKGGKGIATSIGVLLGADPQIAALTFGAFVVMFVIQKFKRDNLWKASITGAFTAPFCSLAMGHPGLETSLLFLLIPLALFSHRTNIKKYNQSLKKPLS